MNLKSILCGAALALVPFLAAAKSEPELTGPTILTVYGDFDSDGVEDMRDFDLASLDAMTQGAFETTTIWTEGLQSFSGVYVHTILESLGLTEGELFVSAINDYVVSMPVSEMRPDEALLATRRNGDEMSIRDKGPIWVVYPYDSDDEFRSEVVYSRSVWQVKQLRVELSE
ncbi:oxidoreductase [Celeribacter marinus]|uniref:oxidoreductase n=1 Tax=Celeribacter marinus TaxID=1397108 RepID=UPI003F6B2E83